MYGVGWPFDPRHSSNSTRRPRLFDWTDDPSEATLPVTVCLDGALRSGVELPGRKIAWIAESPATVAWQRITWHMKADLDRILDAYEVLLTSDRSLCLLDPRIVYHPPGSNLPWIPESQYGIHRKSKLCSMFASSKRMVRGHAIRHRFAEALRGSLDLFGGACGSPRIGGGGAHPDKGEGLLPYMFSVAMENCRVPFYYSEKITDCFATGTVPVYWGSDAIGEIFDTDGILSLDDDFDPRSLGRELYESMLPAIRNNLEIVRRLESADDVLYRRFIRRE